ncbi:hypothetical protein MTX26_31005 [Bradyrhizobium sp. ISRA443]|uniref:hypothetical protein n=1 Tax=unclassified Bradyrhizobium TaxID=2631580 RepID=UPI00247AD413|nr:MULTISPECIES: hypothetical protein [unclassified Bradyrhizobium]WGR93973.1 hypothetical protein MTX20_06015 [Bradyrhizobium sp. ISRA435]WGR98600.1 hypothetical protein MTX23_30985 [Bradyrhizobium sp. ISRA436]WGS05489.1 hypothetical protein MTX18_31005 [Bradyrhizobium sp. ISRA437]WGS12376.1 hypothetical protein MTX26_31005 [Bradyrhizobium sp. ISRA443]
MAVIQNPDIASRYGPQDPAHSSSVVAAFTAEPAAFPRPSRWQRAGRVSAFSSEVDTGSREQSASNKNLTRDEIGLNRHPALAPCLSMIFSENLFILFRIML